ncbi:InlB B-repeat-containing protein [Bifidobacterium asteroides]|uniref:InlB B-repeat-containing protein n=1 Tax=Bifidobacterium asteroides TaxID=1684 RepID=UPI0037BEF0FC
MPDGGQASRPSPDPSRGGYLFDGWFQGNIAYDFTQPVTGSITLTARWTKADTQHWAISPTQGPAAGGAKFTLTPPAQRGIKFSQASLGYMHSAAIGSDGSLYTWGSNYYGQLGREPSNAWPASRPGPVGFPGKPQATSICFDQTRQQGTCLAAGKNLTPNPDGTWNATTPAYTPGPVPAAIDWTQDGRQQQTDTSNTYRYLSIASLPLTGGNGMLLLLATGLLAAGAATAAKNRRQQTQTNTSHE